MLAVSPKVSLSLESAEEVKYSSDMSPFLLKKYNLFDREGCTSFCHRRFLSIRRALGIRSFVAAQGGGTAMIAKVQSQNFNKLGESTVEY